jgi:hypothetical protein
MDHYIRARVNPLTPFTQIKEVPQGSRKLMMLYVDNVGLDVLV